MAMVRSTSALWLSLYYRPSNRARCHVALYSFPSSLLHYILLRVPISRREDAWLCDVPFVFSADETLFRLAGDSHTAALTEHGALYGWGTFRDGSGVMGFSDAERIQLVPVSVYQPTSADAQVVKVVSGPLHVQQHALQVHTSLRCSNRSGQRAPVSIVLRTQFDQMNSASASHSVCYKSAWKAYPCTASSLQ